MMKIGINYLKGVEGFGLSIGNSGYCIEKGYGWVLNKDNNTVSL